MTSDTARTANLLGALAVALGDELRTATETAAAHGASAPAALVVIGTYPGRTIDALRPALGLSHSGTVRLVDRLAADDLVVRGAGTDGRSVSLQLTASGRSAMRGLLTERRRALDRPLAALTVAERRQLERISEKLLAAMTHTQAQADQFCRLCDETVCPTARCPVECAIH
jgi:DNA-binding MarR family transcriptional regulator